MAKALKLHGNERLAAGLSVLESGTTAWQEAQRGEYGRAAFHATKALVEAPKTFKVLELTRAGKALLWIGERGNLFLLIIDTPGNIKTDIVGTARAIHLTGDIVYQIVQLWNNIWNNMVKGRESYLKEVNTQSKQFEHLTKDAGIYGSWPWIFGG